jgi:hypothetical protein
MSLAGKELYPSVLQKAGGGVSTWWEIVEGKIEEFLFRMVVVIEEV